MLQPHDQPFQPEPGQVVAAAGLAVEFAEQPGHQGPEGLVGESADQVGGDGEGAGQAMTRGSGTLGRGPSDRR
jgi:hypothetical protein